MFDSIRRLFSNSTESPIIPPGQIMEHRGSYTVYARTFREPGSGENASLMTSEIIHVRRGHKPPGRGWRKC
ncbi:MAG: hypothetical protein H0V70_30370 [Ktedonobacteraceae bacterium]|nr:hypothetical protein [Ktedonobacteraceae bacterium]